MSVVDPNPASHGVTFPDWARLLLGALVFVITYLIAGDYIHIDDSDRALITSIVILLGSVGIVPPRPDQFHVKPAIALGLTLLAIVLGYLAVKFIDDSVLRGIAAAVVALLASVGITPPQVEGDHRQALQNRSQPEGTTFAG